MAITRFERKNRIGNIGVSPNYGSVMRANKSITDSLRAIGEIGVVGQQIAVKQGAAVAKTQAEKDVAEQIKQSETNFFRDEKGNLESPDITNVGNYSIYDQAYREAMISAYSVELETDITQTLTRIANEDENLHDSNRFLSKANEYLNGTYKSVHPNALPFAKQVGEKIRNQFNRSIAHRQSGRKYQQKVQRIETVGKIKTDEFLTLLLSLIHI